jgi:hypothetical protein
LIRFEFDEKDVSTFPSKNLARIVDELPFAFRFQRPDERENQPR